MQCLAIAILTSTAWNFIRWITARSPLDNIPGPSSPSFWTGHLPHFFGRHGTQFQSDVAEKYGPVVKMRGGLGRPLLYIYDPKALHTMLIREQRIYEEEDLFVKSNHLMFGPGLVSTLGDQHRKQRRMLNPVFSVNNMRHMTPTFYSIAYKLRDALQARLSNGPRELDMLNWMGRASLETIAQAGLGCSLDPLVRDKPDEYVDAIKAVVPTFSQLTMLRQLLPYVWQLGPKWLQRRVVELLPSPQLKKMTKLVDCIEARSIEIYNAKKVALEQGDDAVAQQIAERKDIMSILIRASQAASEQDRLSEEEMIAQMTTFLFAGMDTTSNILSNVIDRLTERSDIQTKLREEVTKAFHDGDLEYDQLVQLPYLDAVCRETLRLAPSPAGFCSLTPSTRPTQDVVLPLSKPIRGMDGTWMQEIPIPRGTDLFMGIWGSNRNKELWGDDAMEWKPERWLSPLPRALVDAPIPGVATHLMTFLGGGRSCIGFKFAELNMKVILSVLIRAFKFEPSGKPIVWNVALVRYPTVGTESNVAELPIKVGLI
ncbi:cytochrome P450 [Wolfiporia cocos MD-104 SS10]|uniref:Cytochrome P450 n=1 Tax=Wolfiporia cocos (strain MD-104) TaxID=742152 RepID=A0A2H3JIZ5_WOLCO|nr:cytochrome P450 [Wolfiporia cocos MD-104 SS10]